MRGCHQILVHSKTFILLPQQLSSFGSTWGCHSVCTMQVSRSRSHTFWTASFRDPHLHLSILMTFLLPTGTLINTFFIFEQSWLAGKKLFHFPFGEVEVQAKCHQFPGSDCLFYCYFMPSWQSPPGAGVPSTLGCSSRYIVPWIGEIPLTFHLWSYIFALSPAPHLWPCLSFCCFLGWWVTGGFLFSEGPFGLGLSTCPPSSWCQTRPPDGCFWLCSWCCGWTTGRWMLGSPCFHQVSRCCEDKAALCSVVKYFCSLTEGQFCTLFTDHCPLAQTLHASGHLCSPWQQHHLSAVTEFVSDVIFQPGHLNVVADALSCPPALLLTTVTLVVDNRKVAAHQQSSRHV